ncbi:MAG: hypothetical protein H7X88_06045 [Gloeobacteraceae cyanobacterium ES-bin-316]|nr:hypothetical protein [Ferruginibacter sp.]
MKKLLLYSILAFSSFGAAAQGKTELYDLLKKLMYDSTGYENVGDWAVGAPQKFPVSWKADKLEMSDDTSINFYRVGSTEITIKGRTYTQSSTPVKWNIMLKGPRMGYASYSIISSPSKDFLPRYTIDSLLGKKNFKARLIKSCDSKDLAGYYYYEVKFPKKDPAFVKFSWVSVEGNTAIRIDAYDSWSKYAVKLDCPK